MKSILVIDTPKNCGSCKLVWKYRGVSHCNKGNFKIDNDRVIHPQCPLQEGVVITKKQQTDLLEALEYIKKVYIPNWNNGYSSIFAIQQKEKD